jgi:hypothetical protein
MKSALPGKKECLYWANSEQRSHRWDTEIGMNGKSYQVRFPVHCKNFWQWSCTHVNFTMLSKAALTNQHTVAIAVKTVACFDCPAVRCENTLSTREGAH